MLKQIVVKMRTTEKLSNMQIELINMFNYKLSEKQLKDVKDVLSDYFAKQVTLQIDDFFVEKKLDTDTIDSWAKEHMRKKM